MTEYELTRNEQTIRVRKNNGEYQVLVGKDWQKLPMEKTIIEKQIKEYGTEVKKKDKVEVAAIAAVKMVPSDVEEKLARAKRYIPAYFNTRQKENCLNKIKQML